MEALCSIKCVNCHSPSHEADSDTCPEYVEMKAILKTAATQGIKIKEARLQHNRQFSKAVLCPPQAPPLSDPASQQVTSLQAQTKLIREIAIPSTNASIQSLTQDLEETKGKFEHIDARFDGLEKKNRKPAPPPNLPTSIN